MTCRHDKGDPRCTAQGGGWSLPVTPDKNKFKIVKVHEGEGYLILKVQYPNCDKCAYEGNKVLVFRGIKAVDALFWDELDPHFRPPRPGKVERIAPSPIARFPSSDQGWADAILFVGACRGEVPRG